MPAGEPRRVALPDNAQLRNALKGGEPGAVLRAVLDGTLIVALTPRGEAAAAGADGAVNAGAETAAGADDGPAPLAVMRGGDGTLVALGFSGPGTLGAWGGTDRAASGPGRAMAALIRDQGVAAAVLDVAGPVAASLDHADLRALASGVAEPGEPEPVGEGRRTPLRLRAPDPPLPSAARDALAAALVPHRCVDTAYAFEGPDLEGTRRLWLGLDVPPPREPDATAAAFEAALAALRPRLPEVRLEYTIVERDAVLAALAEVAPAVYRR